ncbi:hypothetical protein KR018_007281, partial [Drosophila ironensis]
IPEERKPRWWFGGLASSLVLSLMAPLDTIKTHMQIQNHRRGIIETARIMKKFQGVPGFYAGFSAALFNQLTYTNIRFSIYDIGTELNFVKENFYMGRFGVGLAAGGIASVIGIPSDMINVRMQTDMRNPPLLRRNYKHVFDALWRIPKEEGFLALYRGGSLAFVKSSLNNCTQIGFYDIVNLYQYRLNMEDRMPLHFISSLTSSFISTPLVHPLDVMKTVKMNERPGQFKNMRDVFRHMMRFGVYGPFRGIGPTLVRKPPATILLFVIYEQLRLSFGYDQ